MAHTGIALGSNLGDRLENLRAALRELATISEGETLCAPVYESEPVLCPDDSPRFYNSVIEIEWNGGVFDLLEKTQALEKQLGRETAPVRNAPRLIDIDLLYCGNETLVSETLNLPHPGIGLRRFVLEPLAEIRPSLVLPGKKTTIAEMLKTLCSDEPPLRKVCALWEI